VEALAEAQSETQELNGARDNSTVNAAKNKKHTKEKTTGQK
jgi:hypothetical protein